MTLNTEQIPWTPHTSHREPRDLLPRFGAASADCLVVEVDVPDESSTILPPHHQMDEDVDHEGDPNRHQPPPKHHAVPTNDWDIGKKTHLELSAAAAESYDELYEKANFATGSYMRYELEVIKRYVSQAPDHAVAVDLGCGTGRDSFVLARFFDQVYAYDFSPEMIVVADRHKLTRPAGNVYFAVLDVDRDHIPAESQSVSFVNTAFGMGSFVNNLDPLFREVRRVLQPGGIAVFSFYNREALVNSMTLQWKPALAARVVEGADQLHVDFESRSYDISARAYTLPEVKHKLEGNFKLLEITTFPTLSALFPQDLFAHKRAQDLCTRVDNLVAGNMDIAGGPYIVAVCQKGGTAPEPESAKGYMRVLMLLQKHRLDPEIIGHGPVKTIADVRQVLNVDPAIMIKSILIAADPNRHSGERASAELYLIAVPANRKLDLGKVAKRINRPREYLRLANPVEVEDLTGFTLGSIPPFGLPKNIPIMLDERLAPLRDVWCGTGKSTESMHLTIDQLRMLSTFTIADISKPDIR